MKASAWVMKMGETVDLADSDSIFESPSRIPWTGAKPSASAVAAVYFSRCLRDSRKTSVLYSTVWYGECLR